ncbi:hypothetical protein JW752_01585 [Candidatus Peregrinibacteria bacterium]|nr:hypothetical protein [Candidatus Peregrinibacteria bacterium]
MTTFKLTFRSPIYQPRSLEQALRAHGLKVTCTIPFESTEVEVEGDAGVILGIRDKLDTLFFNTFYKAETILD